MILLLLACSEAQPLESDADSGAEPFSVRINEVCTDNESTYADEAGEFDDWVELVNLADAPRSLLGATLTDGSGVAWALPDTTLAPGGRVVLSCDGETDQGPLHGPFALEKDGESLTLRDADRVLADEVEVPALDADASWARVPDGDGPFVVADDPTPGRTND